MSPIALIHELIAGGIELAVVGDRLRFRPVDQVDDRLVGMLREHKKAVIEIVEQWGERAAIREYDGGQDRSEAEASAWDEVFNRSDFEDSPSSAELVVNF